MNDFIKFLSISVRIFGFFGKILDFSSNLRSSPWNIGNCLASGSSEALVLKLSDMFRGKGMGRVSEKLGSL